MTALDLPILLFQISLPLGLLALLLFRPAPSVLGYGLQCAVTGLSLLAISLISLWLLPPWWTPYLYLGLWVAIVGSQRGRWARRDHSALPDGLGHWLLCLGYLGLGAAAAVVSATAFSGYRVPGSNTVDLPLPLGPGIYLVAHGGASTIVNGHLATLNPSTPRQQSYRGQSYAVDLVEINRFGLRTRGWRPVDPAAYFIFDTPVFAPCSGTVKASADDLPDMQVPDRDTRRLEGNFVFLVCEELGVLLAHLKAGSITVVPGAAVAQGQLIGRVGNSGNSTEPHLHIHAQRLSETADLLAGDPVPLTLDGRFPVRNDRLIRTAAP